MRFPRAAATAAILVCLLAPTAGADNPPAVEPPQTSADTYRALDLFGEVFERVRADYVQNVSDEKLIEAAINGMLSSLDPHSNYMNAKSFRDMQVEVQGEFGGLGIEVTQDSGLIKVISPIDDTPAARAGLKPNDYIVEIDGKPVLGMSLNEAVEKMRGPIGSEIKLTIRRQGRDPFQVTMKRAVVKIQSVKSQLEGKDIGYIRITSFNEQADSGVKNAIKTLQDKSGNKLVGLVLDLRNNPGGLLDQAVEVANDFIQQGEIVSTRGRHPEDAQRYNAQPPGDLTHGLPMVVLINGGSASASEIVAGALQDRRRATILGTRSFGKGSVQTIIPLDGHGALRLTTARYYTPSGRSIQDQGISPDIRVPLPKNEAVANEEVIHESDLRGALRNPATAVRSDVPAGAGDEAKDANAAERTINPTLIGTGQDYQLTRALAEIHEMRIHPAARAQLSGS